MAQVATPVSGLKRPAGGGPAGQEQLAGSRQAKFRRLIGDGESKDLDSYRCRSTPPVKSLAVCGLKAKRA